MNFIALAIKFFNKCVKNGCANKELFNKIIDYYNSHNQKEQALQYYQKACEMYNSDIDIFINYAIALIQLRKYKNAINVLEGALKINPDNKMIWFYLAITYLHMNDFDNSLINLNKFIDLDPEYVDAYMLFYLCYLNREEYDKAILYINKTLEKNKDYNDIHYYYGNVLLLQNKKEEALEHYLMAQKIKAKDSSSIINNNPIFMFDASYEYEDEFLMSEITIELLEKHLALILFGKREYDKAIVQFEKYQDINPHDYTINKWLGECYINKKKYEDAIRYFNKYVELSEDCYDVSEMLSVSYLMIKKYDEAIDACNLLLDINPDHLNVLHTKGLALQSSHQYNEAITEFKKLLSLNENAEAYLSIGKCYLELNDIKNCKKMLEKAFKISPELKETASLNEDFENVKNTEWFKDLL